MEVPILNRFSFRGCSPDISRPLLSLCDRLMDINLNNVLRKTSGKKSDSQSYQHSLPPFGAAVDDTVRHMGFSQSAGTQPGPRGEGTELQPQTRKGALGIEESK